MFMLKWVAVLQFLFVVVIVVGAILIAPYVGDAVVGLVDRVDYMIGYDQ